MFDISLAARWVLRVCVRSHQTSADTCASEGSNGLNQLPNNISSPPRPRACAAHTLRLDPATVPENQRREKKSEVTRLQYVV